MLNKSDDEIRAELAAVYASTSWKLTGPLRFVIGSLKSPAYFIFHLRRVGGAILYRFFRSELGRPLAWFCCLWSQRFIDWMKRRAIAANPELAPVPPPSREEVLSWYLSDASLSLAKKLSEFNRGRN